MLYHARMWTVANTGDLLHSLNKNIDYILFRSINSTISTEIHLIGYFLFVYRKHQSNLGRILRSKLIATNSNFFVIPLNKKKKKIIIFTTGMWG